MGDNQYTSMRRTIDQLRELRKADSIDIHKLRHEREALLAAMSELTTRQVHAERIERIHNDMVLELRHVLGFLAKVRVDAECQRVIGALQKIIGCAPKASVPPVCVAAGQDDSFAHTGGGAR